ncbi:MAG: hypothetical protein ABIQ02_03015, partial [Saprospiraceae bacterium]
YGKRNKFFYKDAMEWYAGKWKSDKGILNEYPFIKMPAKDLANDYFDMAYPDVAEDGSVYSAITTFDRTAAIYKIDPEGKRTKVISMGLQQDHYFDQSNHRFVWTELRFDPRWIRKDKNVIIVYDESSGKKKKLIPVKGFYTPSLDKAGTRIAALHADLEGNYAIQILDALTGSLLATLPNKDNLYLSYPIWSEDEVSIIATARDDKGRMALVEEDIATGDIKLITHYSYNVLGRPFLHGDWIYLTSSLDTLDQVYAVDRHEGVFYRLSSGNSAHYDPAWDPSQEAIVCSEYHLDGRKIVSIPGHPGRDWILTGLNDGIKKVEGAGRNLLSPPGEKRAFEIKKYSQWSNVFNVHSWTIVADDPVWQAEIRSNNILNNISIAGGYEYNRNTKASGPYINMRFGMWYPVFSLGLGQTAKKITTKDGRQFRVSNDDVNAGISLPLYFTIGPYQQVVSLSSTYYKGISRLRPKIPEAPDFSFSYLTHKILLINSRNQAYRQAMPTWGQRFDLSYSKELSGVPISLLYLSSDLAFPGLKPSHYLLLRSEYLSQDTNSTSIQLSNPYVGARGYGSVEGKHQYRFGITYGFPIWYPDFGYGNIFYSKRVRLQPFFDVAYSDDINAPARWMRSTGAELIVDFNFPPISLGIRYSKLLSGDSKNSNVFEFFIPVQRF